MHHISHWRQKIIPTSAPDVCTSHVLHINESCFTNQRVMSHVGTRQGIVSIPSPTHWYVQHTSIYNTHPCTAHIHVQHTSMYSTHPCTTHIHVSYTYNILIYVYCVPVNECNCICTLHFDRRRGIISHVNASCCTCECVMLHMWMRHVAHVNESCCTCECVMLHMWMRYIAHVNASCPAKQRVIFRINRCPRITSTDHISHINESCLTHQRVMSHKSTSHVSPLTDAKESSQHPLQRDSVSIPPL